jgi:hypothetical protein
LLLIESLGLAKPLGGVDARERPQLAETLKIANMPGNSPISC